MNIVQIGCCDGNDDVFQFINNNYENIKNAYLIEPVLLSLNKAKDLYQNMEKVKFLNIAITDDEKLSEIEMYIPNTDSWNSSFQACSNSKAHAEQHFSIANIIGSKLIKVKAETLNNLFDDLKMSKVDRLYIDTEGLDCKIVDSVDIEKYNIEYIQFEYIHCKDVLDSIINKLNSLNYDMSYDTFNIFANRKNKK